MRKEEEEKKKLMIAQVGHDEVETLSKPALPSIGKNKNALRKAGGCISVK